MTACTRGCRTCRHKTPSNPMGPRLNDHVTGSFAFKSPLALLTPSSVAIVGASERSRWATRIYGNLRNYGFPGKIFPVNPRGGEVWGAKCYPDLASLPEPPDHALVIVPAPGVQGILETGVAAGLKSATVYAS